MIFSAIKKNLSTLRYMNWDSSEFREGIASIVRDCLSGQWECATSKNLLIQKLRGGMSNSVFKVTLSSGEKKQLKDEPKTVIMRFYQHLDHIATFEQMAESLTFIFLSERNLGPKLFGIFPGGRIEEHLNARPLRSDELSNKNFTLAIAEKTAHIHSTTPPLSKKKGLMFDLMEKWLVHAQKLPVSSNISHSGTLRCVEYFKKLDLKSEISWLREFVDSQDSPIMFCHNDLQEGNIMVTHNSVNSEKPDLVFIDYEYCFYNYRGFELANHFLEYTMNYEVKNYPYFIVSKNDYPSLEHQLLFIRQYLSVSKALKQTLRENKNGESFKNFSAFEANTGSDINEEEAKLLKETSNFRMASHLFWGIWAALRSQSEISFGYWEYCHARLKAYFEVKEEIQLQERL